MFTAALSSDPDNTKVFLTLRAVSRSGGSGRRVTRLRRGGPKLSGFMPTENMSPTASSIRSNRDERPSYGAS